MQFNDLMAATLCAPIAQPDSWPQSGHQAKLANLASHLQRATRAPKYKANCAIFASLINGPRTRSNERRCDSSYTKLELNTLCCKSNQQGRCCSICVSIKHELREASSRKKENTKKQISIRNQSDSGEVYPFYAYWPPQGGVSSKKSTINKRQPS